MKETISKDFKKLLKSLSLREVKKNHNLRRKMRKIEKMLGQLDVYVGKNDQESTGGAACKI
jgi:hypothetical protein